MTAIRHRVRRAGALLPLAVAAAGLVLLSGGPTGPGPGAAGDRYRAGERSLERRATAGPEAHAARDRALARAAAVGLPTGPHVRTSRLTDRFAGVELDEVVIADAAGRARAIVRMRPDGRVTLAVRIGWRARDERAIGAGAAAAQAAGHARALDLAAGGTPAVRPDVDGGWRATWGRTRDGVPVLGDGTTVTLFADGTFHAAAERERPLAAAPAEILARAVVTELAATRLADLLGPADAAAAELVDLELAWVAPNDTFDGARPDAPDPILRLAWVAAYRTAGTLAERLRAIELYLDAGDGSLLGGDLLR
jgi:hypothetical protein